MDKLKITVKSMKGVSFLPALLLFLLLCVVGIISVPYFTKMSFISSICRTYAPMIVLCLGQAIVIIGGGIDISIGATASLCSTIVAYSYGAWGLPLPIALAAGLLTGLVCGLANGLIIGYLRINPLITTFAMSWITGGLALWILPVSTDYPLCNEMLTFYKSSVLGIPTSFLILVVLLIIWQLIIKTQLGSHLYAMGDHFQRAYVSGVNVQKTQVISYMLAGICSGLAGLCIFGSIGRGDASVGDTYTLQTIAACVIGGISLSGGKGQAVGAVISGYFIGFLYSLILAFNINAYYQGITNNVIIILGIVIPCTVSVISQKRKQRKK